MADKKLILNNDASFKCMMTHLSSNLKPNFDFLVSIIKQGSEISSAIRGKYFIYRNILQAYCFLYTRGYIFDCQIVVVVFSSFFSGIIFLFKHNNISQIL